VAFARGGADEDDAVTGYELLADLAFPHAPALQRAPGESDQPRVVVGVTEDPRVPAGLTVARHPALIDGDRRAALRQRVRRRQADDPAADDGHVGVVA
jgi:hypothetical protein